MLGTVLVTDLHAACEAQPLAERAARFYVAAAFRALSCVHRLDAVCRACSLEATMLDALDLPTSLHTSRHLPIPPRISPYLPMSRYISQAIMLDAKGYPQLADLSLAKVVSPLHLPYISRISPVYLPLPRQGARQTAHLSPVSPLHLP